MLTRCITVCRARCELLRRRLRKSHLSRDSSCGQCSSRRWRQERSPVASSRSRRGWTLRDSPSSRSDRYRGELFFRRAFLNLLDTDCLSLDEDLHSCMATCFASTSTRSTRRCLIDNILHFYFVDLLSTLVYLVPHLLQAYMYPSLRLCSSPSCTLPSLLVADFDFLPLRSLVRFSSILPRFPSLFFLRVHISFHSTLHLPKCARIPVGFRRCSPRFVTLSLSHTMQHNSYFSQLDLVSTTQTV